jgi:peptide-methionine (R)-S-oxide reductase
VEDGLSTKTSAVSQEPDSTLVYVCANYYTPLFDAVHQFDAGCGFPSFWNHIENNVTQKLLETYGRRRTQLLCHHCGVHLGHLFQHPRTSTGTRYCISHAAILPKKT